MRLYHGSNVIVNNPEILVSQRTLDFGPGFYTTSEFNQAKRWADLQADRRKIGSSAVSVYNFDESHRGSLSVKHFEGAASDWLHFVSENRKNQYVGPKYDLVIGPVADDNTMPVIADFMAGTISEETALILLKPQKLTDQYAFLTYKGLQSLSFEGGN